MELKETLIFFYRYAVERIDTWSWLMRFCATFVPILCLFISVLAVQPCMGQVEKPAESFDSIEALVELLLIKGILSEEEAEKYIEQYRDKLQAAKTGKQIVTIVPEVDRQRYMEQITESVTRRIGETVQEVKQDQDSVSAQIEKLQNEQNAMRDSLLTETRLANQRIDQIELNAEETTNKLRKASWAQRIRFGGDIRLRYQRDYMGENNALFLRPDNPDELINSTVDREQVRYRVRLKMLADIIDDREINVGKVQFGARMTVGNEKNPVSTNDTLGDYYNKDGFVLDRAYLKWKFVPELPMWGEKFPEFSLTGGRMPNPWFSTDLVWDSDVNFEGFSGGIKTDTLMSNPLKWFATAGIFPLQEEEFSDKDKWLYAGQVGAEYTQTFGLSGKIGVAYYEYQNIKGVRNDPLRPGLTDFTAPQFQQKGNTLIDIDPSSDIKTALASDYRLLNVTALLDYDYWFPMHIVLRVDYVKNLGFDKDEVAQLTGDSEIGDQDEGYLVGLKVGHENTLIFGDWNFGVTYKYLEADAVLDAFTDSDFHLGGTNAEGWILEGAYGIYKNLWLNLKWITSNEIEGPPFSVDTLQIDLNGKF
jgi:hypothetical protein